ncbi:hypothetical protein [Microbacterium sp. KNMS]
MSDLDHIDVEAANGAGERLLRVWPFPAVRLGDMKSRDSDAWIRRMHQELDGILEAMNAPRRPGRAWVDVKLADGRWVGRWIDDCPTEAAVACRYWYEQPVAVAGIGLKGTTAEDDERARRLASGDLLALLSDWDAA